MLHPALAEVTDFEASLVGLADLSSALIESAAGPLITAEVVVSIFFLFCKGEAALDALCFLPWGLLVDAVGALFAG